MRLLVVGHHSDTGFGVVTRELATRFLAAGHDVRVLAVNHRGEPVKGALAGRVWPTSMFGDSHGGNLSSAAIEGSLWRQLDPADDWRPDTVLVIADMSGMFGHLGRGISEQWLSVPVYHYCPIEGDNLSRGWFKVWEHFNPVAMSDYGARVISDFLGRPVPRIYHGVDTEVFRPVGPAGIRWDGKVLRSKEECRAAFGLDPQRRVIFRSDRLVERKFYYRLFEALPDIFRQVPDADLVLHCSPVDGNLSIYEEIARLPSEYHERVKLSKAHDTWRGLPTEGLVALMNAADVYVSTTGGEGFGLTLAESLACQVPVVANGWAAEVEVVGNGGILVPPLTDSYGDPVRFHSGFGMDWAVPDARAFVEPVVSLLTRPSRARAFGARGRLHVKRSFSWDTAAAEFLTLFEGPNAARLAS